MIKNLSSKNNPFHPLNKTNKDLQLLINTLHPQGYNLKRKILQDLHHHIHQIKIKLISNLIELHQIILTIIQEKNQMETLITLTNIILVQQDWIYQREGNQ